MTKAVAFFKATNNMLFIYVYPNIQILAMK